MWQRLGFPRFRGHRSGVHSWEGRASEGPLFVVDRTEVAVGGVAALAVVVPLDSEG